MNIKTSIFFLLASWWTPAFAQPCASDRNCDSGICVAFKCRTGLQGAACEKQSDCLGDLRCFRSTFNGVCDEPASEENGVGCNKSEQCVDGQYCIFQGALDAALTPGTGNCRDGSQGDRCRNSGECQDGLVCKGGVTGVSARCEPPGSHGDSCVKDGDCENFCHNFRCRDGSSGSACGSSSDCQDGLTCQGIPGLRTCSRQKISGQCFHDNECFGYCEGFHCQMGLEGQQCKRTNDCVPGLRCKKTCKVCARKRCRGTAVEFGVPVFLQSASHGMVVALKSLEVGADAFVFSPRDHLAYRWIVESGDDENNNIVRIRHIAADLCLHLLRSENKNDGQPIVATCRPELKNQLWEIHGEEIKNVLYGKCLNLKSPHEVRQGGALSVWDCASHKDQNWKFETI